MLGRGSLCRGTKGDGKVVSKSVDHNDHGLVKALLMPASSFERSWCMSAGELYRRDRTLRLVFEHETGKKKAVEEEVNAEDVKCSTKAQPSHLTN